MIEDLFFPSENHRQSLLGRVEAGGFAALDGQDKLEFHAYRYAWRRVRLHDFAQKYQCDQRGDWFDGVLVGRAVEFYGGIKREEKRPAPSAEDIAHVEECCRQFRANLDRLAERNRAAFAGGADEALARLQRELGVRSREELRQMANRELEMA